jgi:aminoglycoside phosphotransferase family enzyme/predicted kinase
MTTHEMATSSTSLKEDLQRPSAYAAFTRLPRAVTLIETHISWVFLLESVVVKVKKPVDLGFLDFRTLARRRAACEAEVVLNARLAEHVYLGVVPIRLGSDGRAQIGGSGALVDWAVYMVRLPDAWRADTLLLERRLGPKTIDAVAARIAEFHANGRHDAETARFGSPEAIATNLQENFAQTRESLGRYLREGESDELVRWQRAFLRGHDELFRRRAASGRVRDGHGDLRLEHVYIEPTGTVTILDCIEFNDRFRFADVCADLAFLSMELGEHGRVDLAERLLAKYARASNDFDLYALVDFYQSYRGFVRGKVAAMLADDETADAPTRHRADAEARRYFLHALSATRRSLLLPAVVAVGGLIASGKSTIAERIGDAMSAPIIDADRTRKAMLGVAATRALEETAWQGAYDPNLTTEVYAEVLRRAAVVLASGRPVVLDASFRSAEMRRAARDLASTYGVPFRFVECRANDAACRTRLVERAQQPDVSDGRLEIFDAFAARFEPVTELPASEHIVVDTTRPIEESEAVLRATLDTWPEGFVA